jgi:hypothetical protein
MLLYDMFKNITESFYPHQIRNLISMLEEYLDALYREERS